MPWFFHYSTKTTTQLDGQGIRNAQQGKSQKGGLAIT